MAQEVIWTERASDDLHNIFDYLSTFSDDRAELVVGEIIARAFLLEKFPKLGRMCQKSIFRASASLLFISIELFILLLLMGL